MLLIKDPGHFAIDSGLLYVVATAVVGDLEDFEGEVFRLRKLAAAEAELKALQRHARLVSTGAIFCCHVNQAIRRADPKWSEPCFTGGEDDYRTYC